MRDILSFVMNGISEGKTNQETYLNIEQIVRVAKKIILMVFTLAMDFFLKILTCKSTEENGITFIAPHSEAVRLMGDKAVSKTLAEKHNIPVVPVLLVRLSQSLMQKKLLKKLAIQFY